jgi:hypothetical protein
VNRSPDRFILEPLTGGGVLLDLDTGLILRLNESATLVWQRTLAGEAAESIAAALAARYGISVDSARAGVAAALTEPPPMHASMPDNDLRYEQTAAGYRLLYQGLTALEIDVDRAAVRLARPLEGQALMIALLALGPKLAVLFGGGPVLHAASVSTPRGDVLAFLGASGAGKTTTARAFARAGYGLVSEDKLVLRLQDGRPLAVLSGEATIRSWITTARMQLASTSIGDWCPIDPLRQATSGDGLPLATVMIVDQRRREGTELLLEPLSPAEAAGEIVRNAFHGSSTDADWRHQLRAAAAIARHARVLSATMPAGLDGLAAAARRYTETTIS